VESYGLDGKVRLWPYASSAFTMNQYGSKLGLPPTAVCETIYAAETNVNIKKNGTAKRLFKLTTPEQQLGR
jgi:hypothetical protein